MAKKTIEPDDSIVDPLTDEETKLAAEMGAEIDVEPEVVAEPEVGVEVKAEVDDPDEGKTKTVPHAALHEEREKRKAAEDDRQKADERADKFEQRLTEFMETQQAKEEMAEVPGYEDDPIGNLDHRLKAAEEDNRQFAENDAQRTERETQDDHERQFTSEYSRQAQTFAAENPDFNDAYQHLLQDRAAELRLMGMNETEMARALYQDERAIAQRAMAAGINPAAQIYELATRRGYTKTADVGAKLDKIEVAQGRNESLSAVSGTSPTPPSLEAMASMSDADFAEKFGAMSIPQATREYRKLMGE